eukprot:10987370-Ditylum_brightwellii.AAC.1
MMRRFKTLMKETLKESGTTNSGMIDELMALKGWYLYCSVNMDATSKSIEEVFTQVKEEEEAEEAKPPTPAKSMKTKGDEINVSYKVETKENPKLPANKLPKGKIFDEWYGNVYVKMCQAKVTYILKKNYVTPDAISRDYELHKTKNAFLKNHLLTATIGSNTSSFINVQTMTGVKMYITY